MIVYKSRSLKNLQIENRSLSCQGWQLNGFQISHFICYRFGCKLWLLSIQNFRITLKKSSQYLACFRVHSHEKKKWLVAARHLQSIKTFFELSLYRKSCSLFSSSEPIAARSDCRQLGNALCLCSHILSAQAVPESGPKSLAFDLAL